MAARRVPAAPGAIILNNRTLTWTWTWDTNNPASNIVFVVHSSPSLSTICTNWPVIAVCTTNGWPFVLSQSVPAMFYHVQTSNTVSGLASP